MKLLVFYALLSQSFEVGAVSTIGTVSKLRGQVSMLELGEKIARDVQVGQAVNKDASILTSEKSFVQIVMQDKSQINLGPNSKIVLDQVNAGKVGVISLIKGMIRAEVTKDSQNSKNSKNSNDPLKKNKLFIISRTAAMGIRGTDFQASYNPESKITNLITFEGSVSLVKTNIQNYESSLDGKSAVMVESGKFATVTETLINATEPIKISPTQFTALKLNPEMEEKNLVKDELFQLELKKTQSLYTDLSKKEIDEKNLGSKVFNSNLQVFRPTAGGLVDLASGIYVPPTVEPTNYVKELNIYDFKPQNGSLTETGQYLPPSGMKLDSRLGFISDSSKVKSEDIRNLNSEIAGQIKKPNKPKKEDLGSDDEDLYEKYYKKE